MNTTRMNDYACMSAGIAPQKLWAVINHSGYPQHTAKNKDEVERWHNMMRANASETAPIHSFKIVEMDDFPDIERNHALALEVFYDFIKKHNRAEIILQENLIAISINGQWICTGNTIGNVVIQCLVYLKLNEMVMNCNMQRLEMEMRKKEEPSHEV